VLDPLEHLEGRGFKVSYLGVDRRGMIDLQKLSDLITSKTILVSLMHANNETGVLHPVEEIGAICRKRGVLFHTDATQTFGKELIDVESDCIDLLSASAHKLCGPKGAGLLYVRKRNPRVRCEPLQHGGGHEKGLRSGTLATHQIVGMGEAFRLARVEMAAENERIRMLRDRLLAGFKDMEEIYVNGDLEHRVPHNLNVSFNYVEGESLIMGMKELAVSSGSACTSASLEPSYVLKALGAGDDLAHSSIRFGLGRWSTEEEVDYVVEKLTTVVRRLREMSPLYEMVKEGVDLSKMQWVTH